MQTLFSEKTATKSYIVDYMSERHALKQILKNMPQRREVEAPEQSGDTFFEHPERYGDRSKFAFAEGTIPLALAATPLKLQKKRAADKKTLTAKIQPGSIDHHHAALDNSSRAAHDNPVRCFHIEQFTDIYLQNLTIFVNKSHHR